jgi:hypothetical protein
MSKTEDRIEELEKRTAAAEARVAELEAKLTPPRPPASKMVPLWSGGPMVEATGFPGQRSVSEPPVPRETDPEVLALGRAMADDIQSAAARSKTDWGLDASHTNRPSHDPTPPGASVGRPGGPRGPE